MDNKCNEILSNILSEAGVVFVELKKSHAHSHTTVDDYIERLGKLTSIVMSVKTSLALSNQPVGFFNSSDISKEESV